MMFYRSGAQVCFSEKHLTLRGWMLFFCSERVSKKKIKNKTKQDNMPAIIYSASLLLRVTKEKEKSLTFPLSPVATAQSMLVSER